MLLLLDLVVVHLLKKGVLSFGPVDILGLVVLDILVINVHLVWIIPGHGCVHLIHIIDNLSTLGLNPRLTHGGYQNTTAASPFFACISD